MTIPEIKQMIAELRRLGLNEIDIGKIVRSARRTS